MLRGMREIRGGDIFWLVGCFGGRKRLVKNQMVKGVERGETVCFSQIPVVGGAENASCH